MFWIVIAIFIGAATFIELGALSVTVKLLSAGLTLSILVVVCLACVLIWRRIKHPRLLNHDRS